jgi:hypothetical protein
MALLGDGTSIVLSFDSRYTRKEEWREPKLKRTLVAMIMALAAAIPMLAKPKENTYATNCDRVWVAVKRATAQPHYNFAQLDDAQKKGIVSTGNFATGKRLLDITLSGTGSTCTVAIGGSFSGLAHNDKGDLFERIKEALIETPESPAETTAKANTPSPTEATVIKAISAKLLTNADVLKLKTAGLSDQLIIDKINASPSDYRLDTNDLVELKQASLSDTIIAAMIQASQR